jgi:ABC-type glycerol-3-phosphate transport system permease component
MSAHRDRGRRLLPGAGIFGIYRRIMLPLSWPGFVVVIIWQFTSMWNEFLFAIVLTSDPELDFVQFIDRRREAG